MCELRCEERTRKGVSRSLSRRRESHTSDGDGGGEENHIHRAVWVNVRVPFVDEIWDMECVVCSSR